MYETTLLETLATRQQRAVMPAKVTSNVYQINETRDSFRDPRWRRILQVCSPRPPHPLRGWMAVPVPGSLPTGSRWAAPLLAL